MISIPFLLASAVGTSAVVLRDSAVHLDKAEIINSHAPHEGDHPTVFAVDTGSEALVDQVCFQFTFDDPKWAFTDVPPWGAYTNTFGNLADGGRLCQPTNDGAGGAMYIGPGPTPGPGDTKIECFFPASSDTANCDISLVDGYSLSVSCQADGQPTTIGGDVDLWQQGINCPDQQGDFCKNDNGYGPEAGVDAFFQPAINNGNNYCIFVNCTQDYYFPTTSTINCHVGGTAK